MDALRQEIQDEIKRTRLDKTRLFNILEKMIDICSSSDGSSGPAGPAGPRGPAGSSTPPPPPKSRRSQQAEK